MKRLLFAAVLLLSTSARADVLALRDATALKGVIEKAESNGHPVVVHFFALWCDDCMAEMPLLSKVVRRAEKDGATVLLISLDPPRKVVDIDRFLHRYPIEGAAYLLEASDPDPVVAVIDPSWHASIPATFVFQNGHRTASFKGPLKQEDSLDEVLSKSDPAPQPTPSESPAR